MNANLFLLSERYTFMNEKDCGIVGSIRPTIKLHVHVLKWVTFKQMF